MFLEMRREAVDRGIAPFSEHKTMTSYEKRGVSKRYSYYSLPENCETVLFPGCTFTGTRPDTLKLLFSHLKKAVPSLGIVLDCCCKPSHDLGKADFFQKMFSEMKQFLVAHGIKKIITTCPNCHIIFKNYGNPLKVEIVYETLLNTKLPTINQAKKLPAVSVHDPCVLRRESSIQNAVRELALAKGFKIEEMPHHRNNTYCCGEGGTVGFVMKELSNQWGNLRVHEADGRRLLTYCAGCAGFLNKKIPTDHIIDAIFNPKATLNGKGKVAKAPWTYLNRIRIKHYIKKNFTAAVTRERTLMKP